MTYSTARAQPRVFRQLTGLTIEEFDQLLPAFQAAYEGATRGRISGVVAGNFPTPRPWRVSDASSRPCGQFW